MAETADFPQVTPSNLCNTLIEVMRQVHMGEEDPSLLRRLAQERLAELPDVRAQTMDQIRSEGPEHMQAHAVGVAALEAAFQDMEVALQAACRYADNPQEETFLKALEALMKAGYSSQLSTDTYQRSELAHGPTEFPLINLLHRLKEGHFETGLVSRVDLDAGIEGARRMTLAAAEEIRSSQPETDQKMALIRAYENMAEVLGRVAEAVDKGQEAVDEVLQEAAMSGAGVRAAMEALVFQDSTAGPTRMAHANLVLKMAELHQSGGLPAETLARGLEVFRNSQKDLLAEIEALASIPSDSDGVAQQMEPTRAAFKAHWEALALFDRYLQGEPEQYDSARKALISAAEALADCQEAFERIGEMANKVPCVRCGTRNEPANRSCSNCGAQLLMQTGMGASSSTLSIQEDGGQAQIGGELVMTENLMRLFKSVNGVAEGRLDLEDFQDVLDWFENLVSDNLLEVPEVPELSRDGLNEEQVEQLAQVEARLATARDEVQSGGQELLAAIEELRKFVVDSETRHLVEGVRMVRDASVKVQLAQGLIEELVEANRPAR
jgi:hypothetical protein